MNELIVSLLCIWSFISAIWLSAQAFTASALRTDFQNFLLYHKKVMGLYVEVAMRNRELLRQNQKLKHAVADHVFAPLNYDLVQVKQWYDRYEIKQGAMSENESAEDEINHFLTIDANETRHHEAAAS